MNLSKLMLLMQNYKNKIVLMLSIFLPLQAAEQTAGAEELLKAGSITRSTEEKPSLKVPEQKITFNFPDDRRLSKPVSDFDNLLLLKRSVTDYSESEFDDDSIPLSLIFQCADGAWRVKPEDLNKHFEKMLELSLANKKDISSLMSEISELELDELISIHNMLDILQFSDSKKLHVPLRILKKIVKKSSALDVKEQQALEQRVCSFRFKDFFYDFFSEYKDTEDRTLVDEECSWHQDLDLLLHQTLPNNPMVELKLFKARIGLKQASAFNFSDDFSHAGCITHDGSFELFDPESFVVKFFTEKALSYKFYRNGLLIVQVKEGIIIVNTKNVEQISTVLNVANLWFSLDKSFFLIKFFDSESNSYSYKQFFENDFKGKSVPNPYNLNIQACGTQYAVAQDPYTFQTFLLNLNTGEKLLELGPYVNGFFTQDEAFLVCQDYMFHAPNVITSILNLKTLEFQSLRKHFCKIETHPIEPLVAGLDVHSRELCIFDPVNFDPVSQFEDIADFNFTPSGALVLVLSNNKIRVTEAYKKAS